MFQPAQALQPHFDPPLPPFRTSHLESWFEEFEAALELNGIWLQEFMFEVLEYHLPRDLKRRLTYFSWTPRPYDHLRDAVLQFYGIKHGPFPKSNAAAPGSSSSTCTPPAPRPVQTIALPTTTGCTGDAEHPSASIDPLAERPTTPASTVPASDVPVLPTKALPPLSVTDSTPATAPRTSGFSRETCYAALPAVDYLTITAKPPDPPSESTPVLTPVEARDTAHTTDPEPAVALHAIGCANTSAPAAQSFVDCQPGHLSSNVSTDSPSFPGLPARISCHLPVEPRPSPYGKSTTQIPSAVVDSHSPLLLSSRHFRGGCTSSMHSARTVVSPEHTLRCRQTHNGRRSRSCNARRLAWPRQPRSYHFHHQRLQRTYLLCSLLLATRSHRGPRPLRGSQCRPPEPPDSSLRLPP
uniref:Uncharacterized protein n=1 Tax=Rhipicephalus zambeziensis TaxID=60191 RepID=A0A224YKW1_9ACAR